MKNPFRLVSTALLSGFFFLPYNAALACEKAAKTCGTGESNFSGWIIPLAIASIFVDKTLWDRWNSLPEPAALHRDDPRMVRAKARALATIGDFWDPYNNPAPEENDFSLKVSREYDDGQESIWVAGISIRNGKMFGHLTSDPVLGNDHAGDRITFDAEQICDWCYYRGEEMIGNYTIAVMFEALEGRKRRNALKALGWTEQELALRA